MNALLLDLDHLGHSYGNFEALRDLNLKLAPGRIGLLGPNGAGKSTLLKILMGLINPTSGSGKLLDKSINPGPGGDGAYTLRRMIGFMPEADALVPGLKGVEYVALAGELCGMPRHQAQRRAHEVLTYLELEDARYRRLDEYSTGMKQRLKLAQALIHDPPVLLLDEPTSGLDPAGRDAMLRLMLELGRDFGKSLIISTHLLADVETVCEQVVILYNGQVCGQGAVADLCARRQDRYRLQPLGDTSLFRKRLLADGIEILSDDPRGGWRISVPAGWAVRSFFVYAESCGVVIRGVWRDDETLEELFLRTVAKDEPALAIAALSGVE